MQKRREQSEGFGSIGEGGLERCGDREDAVNEELQDQDILWRQN